MARDRELDDPIEDMSTAGENALTTPPEPYDPDDPPRSSEGTEADRVGATGADTTGLRLEGDIPPNPSDSGMATGPSSGP